MAIAPEQPRPYAAPANVIGVLGRARSRNLPEYITNDFLRLSGVPEGAYGRVMQALRFLGMVADDGQPSETLRAISAAPDAQYRELLGAALRTAYADDFERVDPTQDSQVKIQDAFTPYQPRSQIQRMVILFLGLCREAGISVLDVPRDRKLQTTSRESRSQSRQNIGRRARQPERNVAPNPQTASPSGTDQAGVAFGVTDSDLAALDDAEFQTVWAALGTVMRARAKVRTKQVDEEQTTPAQDYLGEGTVEGSQ